MANTVYGLCELNAVNVKCHQEEEEEEEHKTTDEKERFERTERDLLMKTSHRAGSKKYRT